MSATHTNDDAGTVSNQIDLQDIASRLEVDDEELRFFVTNHPDPTPAAVLGYADAEIEHQEAVGQWLDTRRGDDEDEVDGDFSAIQDNLSRRRNKRNGGGR